MGKVNYVRITYVLVIASFWVGIVLSASPPSPVTPSGSITPTQYSILTSIGAASLSAAGSGSTTPTAQNFLGPSRIKTIPAGLVPGGPYQYGGVQIGDNSFRRSLFFRNPIQSVGASASTVFLEPSFSAFTQGPLDSSASFVGVARSRDDVIFADQDRLFIVNLTTYLYSNAPNPPPSAQDYVDVVLGTCSNCTYPPTSFGGVSSIAADDNRIYLGVKQPCIQILVWNQPVLSSYSNPSYALGTALSPNCGTCSGSQTCFVPGAMDVDYNGGLWVFDSTSKNILYFPAGTNVATFAFSAPAGYSFTTAPPTALSWSKTRTNLLAVSTASQFINVQFIFNIVFSSSSGAPTSVSVYTTFGNGTAAGPTTNNIGPVQGIAWDVTNPDYLWVSDQINLRVVQFTPFGTAAGTQTTIPSESGTSSYTPTRTPSTSASPPASPTRTVTPSTGASQSPTSMPSESATFSPSTVNGGSESESSVPAASPGGSVPGHASTLDSWLSQIY